MGDRPNVSRRERESHKRVAIYTMINENVSAYDQGNYAASDNLATSSTVKVTLALDPIIAACSEGLSHHAHPSYRQSWCSRLVNVKYG